MCELTTPGGMGGGLGLPAAFEKKVVSKCSYLHNRIPVILIFIGFRAEHGPAGMFGDPVGA